jgi:hypothetical protein
MKDGDFSTPKAREKLETNEAWQAEGRLGREKLGTNENMK